MSHEWQRDWLHGRLVAEAFDAKTPIGHSYGDVEYYTRHLSEVDGPVLEVGSGTGRLLLRLMEASVTIEGLEISRPMIDVCRTNAAARGLEPVLHHADMTEFERPHAYAAIIVPASAIHSLDGAAETSQALERFRNSLVPGGRLVIDLEIPGRLSGLGPARLWRRDPNVWTLTVLRSDFDALRDQTMDWVRYDKWGSPVGSVGGRVICPELSGQRICS